MIKNTIRLFLCLIGMFLSVCTASERLKDSTTYTLLEKFYSTDAGLILKPGEVLTYIRIDWDFNNLDPIQKKTAAESLKGWKGETYQVSLYKYADNKFVFVKKYYTNDSTEARVNMEEYDLSGKRNLKIPDKSIISGISYLRDPLVLLKDYTQGDLDGDGDEDLVIVYRDTSEKNISPSGYSYPECHMLIYERGANNTYQEVFQYDQLCDMVDIGKVEIRDVTKDHIPEVILWVLSKGASGYGVVAKIFSRVGLK